MQKRLLSGCSTPGDSPRAWTGRGSLKNILMKIGLGPSAYLVSLINPYAHLQHYFLSVSITCFAATLLQKHGQPHAIESTLHQ